MYAITGITGHVGGAAADALIEAGAPVRAVVRNRDKGAAWQGRVTEVAVADFTDRTALTAALTGCRGAFVMLPTVATFTDADHRRMADSIAAAVAASGVSQVVMLSSIGADLAEGNGPIRWLHHLETGLRGSGAVLTLIRSPHFQEKVEDVLGAVRGAGIYPVLGESADVPVPMVATRDVGAAVAHALTAPPAVTEVVDLDAPAYTERRGGGGGWRGGGGRPPPRRAAPGGPPPPDLRSPGQPNRHRARGSLPHVPDRIANRSLARIGSCPAHPVCAFPVASQPALSGRCNGPARTRTRAAVTVCFGGESTDRFDA
ncbi:NAD(P)H-binding protein [Actinoplanes sp. NPDC051633]|uniref:SDR family oxidoreductase n=1 Tax=Actinoplanes sp. NPDC051633 TaxID=3155670 RepID=UPI003418A1C9